AEYLLQKSLSIREEALGSGHPDVAQSLKSMAGVCYTQGRYDEAIRLYARSHEIRENLLGHDHPEVASSFHTRARLLDIAKMYDAAAPLFESALEIRTRILGADHKDTMDSRAGLETCRQKQARQLYKIKLLTKFRRPQEA
ncbi:unnamed protein product, partial [Ectocarpus fasciculatus]